MFVYNLLHFCTMRHSETRRVRIRGPDPNFIEYAGSRIRICGLGNSQPYGGSVLRILDFYPVPNFFYLRSQIRIKECKYFNPKNGFEALGNMIRVVHARSGFRLFNHPGSRGQKGTGPRIRFRNSEEDKQKYFEGDPPEPKRSTSSSSSLAAAFPPAAAPLA